MTDHNSIDYIDNHWWFSSRTRALNALMEPRLPAKPNQRLLDVGCGAGNMIHHLNRFGEVRGLEIDPRPVKIARERGYDVDLFDVTQPMPFADSTFDAVTALDVIEHNEDDLAILRDSYRILKPGGHIVISVPAFMFLWTHNDEINAHVRRYTAEELRQKLTVSGYTVQRMTYNNFFIFPLAAGLLLLRRVTNRRTELASHHLRQDEYQVELEPTSPPVNVALSLVGKIEAGLIRRFDLPVGTSLLAIAQKPLA